MSVTKLDVAYRARTLQIRDASERFAVNSWHRLGAWRDRDYERFVDRVVPRIEAGQQRVAILTDSYIRQIAGRELGGMAVGAVAEASTEALRGVPAAEVYRRPFVEAYTALAEGKPMAAALDLGMVRLASLVNTGVQLARTHSAREAMSRAKFVGYQRVPRGAQSCALCLIASTQRYHRDDLMPIHPGCQCLVKPLSGLTDSQVIDEDLLESVHDAVVARLGESELAARDLGLGKTDAKGRNISDYTDLIVTRTHGELGPVLTWRDHTFTSEKQIKQLAQ